MSTTRDRERDFYDNTYAAHLSRPDHELKVNRTVIERALADPSQTIWERRRLYGAVLKCLLSEKLDGARVLDYGCGPGEWGVLLATEGAEVTLLDLTAAYAVFANGGSAVTPFGIVEVRAGDNVVFRRRGRSSSRVVAPEHVAAMDNLLRAVVDWGTGRAAAFGRSAAGKSGTSQDSRDAWFIGYTDRLVTGVWVGNDSGSAMAPVNGRPVTGGGVPAEIWREFMRAAHDVPARGCR